MDRIEGKGELIVEGSIEKLREAARIMFGASLREEAYNGNIVFTIETPVCPPRIIVEKIGEGKYKVTCQSKCSISQCPYWERCVRIDNERLKAYEITLRKIIGVEAIKEAKYIWIPERLKEEEMEKIIDKLITRKR